MYTGARERKRQATKKIDRRPDISAPGAESVKFNASGQGKLKRRKTSLGQGSLSETDTIPAHIGREIVAEAGGTGDCAYQTQSAPERQVASDYILLSSSDARCLRQIRFGLSKQSGLTVAEIGLDIVREGSVTGQAVIAGSGLVSFQMNGQPDNIAKALDWIRNKSACFTGQGAALFTIEQTSEVVSRGTDSATDPVGKMQRRTGDAQTSDDAAREVIARNAARNNSTRRDLVKRDEALVRLN